MAFSGSQITRLGCYGGPRGLYGSFEGKTEQEPAPEVVETPAVGRTGGFGGGPVVAGVPWSGTDYRERDRIANDLKALYRGVVERIDPNSEEADEAAALVADYTPTNAPDLPPADAVDWTGVVEDGRKAIMRIRLALAAMEARLGIEIREQQIAAEMELQDEEEAAAMVLL